MASKKETPVASVQASVYSRELEFPMRPELDIINITEVVAQAVRDSGIAQGIATMFVPGATGAITCLEYEPGVVADFQEAIERLVPRDIRYKHADGNGHAHVRAGLLGPSLAVPFSGGELGLGVWQQIVLINCDNRPRNRRVMVQVVGA